MASLGSQAIKDSYEQILHVNRSGGGNTSTQVDCYDGDSATKFCFKFNDSTTDQSLFTVHGEHDNGTELRIDTSGDGDPTLAFQLSATNKITMGVDNSDGDKFKLGTTSINTSTILTVWPAYRRVGINQEIPGAALEVKQLDGTSLPVLNLQQLDLGEPFIRFQVASTSTDGSKCIDTDSSEDGGKVGAIMININGTDRWLRFYDSHS